MEYREEFETREDVFRVNVFYNKKSGEKVTMYFVPRTTPVNEDTIFDYCTKNKTKREKQAQQWCDEKNGKNKDKLKSLPFVAAGLQRDLRWFGDNATALFVAYKKGLGMATLQKSNGQSRENQGFHDRLKSLAALGEKEIVQKFNELFKAGGDNWRTSAAGYNASGEALMNAELTIKGKDGKIKTYKTKAGSGIEPAVGKRSAQRNVILAFLAEEYGVGEKKGKQQDGERGGIDPMEAKLSDEINAAEEEGYGEDIKYLHVLDGRSDVVFHENIYGSNYYIDTPYGEQAFFNDGPDSCDVCYYILNTLGVSREAIRTVKVSEEEKEEINRQVDADKTHLIAELEKQIKAQEIAEEKRRYEQGKAEAEQRIQEITKQKKREEFEKLDFMVVEKSTDDADHRMYIIQDDKGHQYKLTIDYGDMKIIDREHHPDWDNYSYGYKTTRVEHQHIEKPMRTLTIAYEKVGGKEDERFALSSSVEPDAFANNPLSVDLVFLANLNLTINQKQDQDKDKALMLRKLLTESKDAINISPKKFKEQKAFKGR